MSDFLCESCTRQSTCNTADLGVSSCWQYEPSFKAIRDHFNDRLLSKKILDTDRILLRTTYTVKIDRGVSLKELRIITRSLNETVIYFGLKI